MKRRDFIALLGGAATAWPLAAGAQTQPKIPRVGFIAGSSLAATGHTLGAFRKALIELGYVEGQSIALEVRFAEGRMERIPELVAELVGLKMDLLVAGVSSAALAAKKATRTIPIVMVAPDPVALGLVASLARPEGNLTGLSYFNEAIVGKRLELIKELVPGLARLAVLRNPLMEAHAIFWQETEMAARKLGVALQPLDVRGPEDFEAAFARRCEPYVLRWECRVHSFLLGIIDVRPFALRQYFLRVPRSPAGILAGRAGQKGP